MTIKVGDRFWFRGDWQTEKGEYEVTEVKDMSWGIRAKSVKNGYDMGWWDASTVASLLEATNAS